MLLCPQPGPLLHSRLARGSSLLLKPTALEYKFQPDASTRAPQRTSWCTWPDPQPPQHPPRSGPLCAP